MELLRIRRGLSLHDTVKLPFVNVYIATDYIGKLPESDKEYESLVTIMPNEKPDAIVYDAELYIRYRDRDEAIKGHRKLIELFQQATPDLIQEKQVTVIEPNEEKLREIEEKIKKALPDTEIQ